MNSNTGHLVTSDYIDSLPDKLKEQFEEDYTPVPEHLDKAARLKLKGQREAYVSKTSGGKLSKWAAQDRKKKRATSVAKRKAAKAARRKNR